MGIIVDKKRVIETRDKVNSMYINGIIVFVGIFSTISLCIWFVSHLNF